MGSKEKSRLLAQYEVGWWKAHHCKDFDRAIDLMAKEYELQFGITYEDAKRAVELRVEATKMHDTAEDFEDKKDEANTKKYWKLTEDLLREHFELIVNKKQLVYTAMSKHLAYFKDHIMKFVLENDCVPLNPFAMGYFLLDTVPRDTIQEANNTLVKRADGIWVFGEISDGVLAEIKLAKQMNKPIKYFQVIKSRDIQEISKKEIRSEEDVRALYEEL